MKIKLNGEDKEVATGTTVSVLLDSLDAGPKGVAVEVNREIVPRSSHASAELRDGDVVEVVRMTGGG